MKKTIKKTKKVIPPPEPAVVTWDIKERETVEFKSKTAITNHKKNRTVLDFSFPNNKIITPDDIKGLLTNLDEEYGSNNVMIKGLNNTQWFSLKGYNQDLKLEDYDDYYDGRVNDASQFLYFYQLQVYVLH